MILPPSRWQRVAITALLVLPLLVVVLLSAPAWLVLPFLSEARQKAVIRYLECLIDWIKTIARIPPEPLAQPYRTKAGRALAATDEQRELAKPKSPEQR